MSLIDIKVWGDYALFSRPEFKVERVSYPVITPSAARGLLEAIFWKPEFRYEIQEIGVLNLGGQTSVLRNEVGIRQAPLDKRGNGGPFVPNGKKRQQRTSLVLTNVAYRLRARMRLAPHATAPVGKYLAQFSRRVERGQYHHAPCLGAREFDAAFEAATPDDVPMDLSLQIGTMLCDLAFVEDPSRAEMQFYRHFADGRRAVSGYARPVFFNAQVADGWLRVPPESYQKVRTLEGRDV